MRRGMRQPGRARASLLAGAVVVAVLASAAPGVGVAAQESYRPAGSGTGSFRIGSIGVRVLVEASNLGGDEVEIVEMTFPPGGAATGGEHRHGRVEIFYVLEGTLDHVVDGTAHRLEPGMVGIVRPGDTVAHRVVGDAPVRTLVIWAPGGELERIAPRGLEPPGPGGVGRSGG